MYLSVLAENDLTGSGNFQSFKNVPCSFEILSLEKQTLSASQQLCSRVFAFIQCGGASADRELALSCMTEEDRRSEYKNFSIFRMRQILAL